jgi:hypothetical protein
MKRLLLAITLLGCGNEAAPAPPTCADCRGGMTVNTWPEPSALTADVLLVVDPALLANASGPDRLRGLAAALHRGHDLHLAVLPARAGAEPGRLVPPDDPCGLGAAPFLDAPLTCGLVPNFAGGLAELTGCLIDTARSQPARQPLEAIRVALEGQRGGSFLRPDTALLIVIVVAHDDDSRGPDGELVPIPRYLEFLSALRAGGGKVTAAVIGPAAVPRLRQFAAGAGRGPVLYLGADWGQATDLIRWNLLSVPLVCLPPKVVDRDPGTPGLQPDCTVTELVGPQGAVTERALPSCDASGPPCFDAQPRTECESGLEGSVQRGGCWPVPETMVRMMCAVAP